MTDGAPKQSWWQTLPGGLTALAAVITAVTGLVVAVNQFRGSVPASATSASAPRPAPPTERAAAPASAAPPASTAAPPSIASAQGSRNLPAGMELALDGGRMLVTVISARLEPFNAEKRVVRLHLRFTNKTRQPVRNYHLTWRLVVDGASLAPDEWEYEQIESQSSKELDYAFRVHVNARAATLRITRDEEVVETALELARP